MDPFSGKLTSYLKIKEFLESQNLNVVGEEFLDRYKTAWILELEGNQGKNEILYNNKFRRCYLCDYNHIDSKNFKIDIDKMDQFEKALFFTKDENNALYEKYIKHYFKELANKLNKDFEYVCRETNEINEHKDIVNLASDFGIGPEVYEILQQEGEYTYTIYAEKYNNNVFEDWKLFTKKENIFQNISKNDNEIIWNILPENKDNYILNVKCKIEKLYSYNDINEISLLISIFNLLGYEYYNLQNEKKIVYKIVGGKKVFKLLDFMWSEKITNNSININEIGKHDWTIKTRYNDSDFNEFRSSYLRETIELLEEDFNNVTNLNNSIVLNTINDSDVFSLNINNIEDFYYLKEKALNGTYLYKFTPDLTIKKGYKAIWCKDKNDKLKFYIITNEKDESMSTGFLGSNDKNNNLLLETFRKLTGSKFK